MFQKFIDGQYRRPTGLVGRWVGNKMVQQHQPENLWTVDRLAIQPTDHILEVGFGPGFAIQEVAKRITTGYVAGVDFSNVMVNAASKRNAEAIKVGRVHLQFGDAAALPFEDSTFDKAYSIHSIYFWPQPARALKELARILKPGGILVITILPKEKWGGRDPSVPVDTPECIPYFGTELEQLMRETGFGTTRIEQDTNNQCASNYSVIAIR